LTITLHPRHGTGASLAGTPATDLAAAVSSTLAAAGIPAAGTGAGFRVSPLNAIGPVRVTVTWECPDGGPDGLPSCRSALVAGGYQAESFIGRLPGLAAWPATRAAATRTSG
jgi:hypothetical protein